jgi:5,10-methylenetetrahydrofolate reductase
MNLTEQLTGDGSVASFYGTVPPREGTSDSEMRAIAGKLSSRLEDFSTSALLVYDVQNEDGRNGKPRPFPFVPTVQSRRYAALLREVTGRPVICYKAAPAHAGDNFQKWLKETRRDFNLRYLSLVGSSSSDGDAPGPTLEKATQMTATVEDPGFEAIGGVTIPERHMAKGNEGRRLLQKTEQGMDFFVSQIIYRPGATVQMLQSYDRRCQEEGIDPSLLVLNFAPCGHRKTLQFMRWLGVDVPDAAEERIFSADDPVSASVQLCRDNLAQILKRTADLSVPLGVAAESVSKRSAEIDASVELLGVLQETVSDVSSEVVSVST